MTATLDSLDLDRFRPLFPDLPSGTLVAMIRRNGTALVPRGSTLVEEEDTLAILRIKDVAKEEKT